MRGHNLKIFKERCRLNIRKNSFIYRSTYVWNSLPQSVVDASSVQSFEVKIDKLWKNHPIKNYFTAPPLLWTVSPLERSGSGVELRTLDYENPVSYPGSGVKTLGTFFHSTLLQFIRLNK